MVTIKSQREIELMRQGGKILAFVLSSLAKEVKSGVTTAYLDELAENLLWQNGALPAFKGFQDYPAALCASVNEEVVHGLPSKRKLKEGDIIGLDLGAIFPAENCHSCPFSANECGGEAGLYTDAAITVAVGKISPQAQKLMKATRESLTAGIEKIRPGRKLSEVSGAIEKTIEKAGFSVVKELVGHGVGYELHEDPEIPNFITEALPDTILKEGMTLAIEPMVSEGDWRIKKSKDGHGYVTRDGSLSAHFEHTVLVTKNGYEILTK
mgnify:CR=1 FL=1